MKIAIDVGGEYNKQGGISRYVAELTEIFVKEHEIHVYATRWKDVGDKRIIFHKMPYINPPALGNFIYSLTSTFNYKYFGSEYDIIHSNGNISLCQDVITTHSVHIAAKEYLKGDMAPPNYGVMDSLILALEKHIYTKRCYKKIIADATSGKYELMKYYNVPEEDIVVIPVGINLDEFKPNHNFDSSKIRMKYGIKEDDIVLIIVATEFFRKGLGELINALNIVKNEGMSNFKLIVIGSGYDDSRHEKYHRLISKLGIRKNVLFTGHVSNRDLLQFYNISDIFVFPTKYEGFGIPTLEAMAMELPVIVSKTGVGGDIVINGKNGFLLENPNNIREIADKIRTLLEDENLRLSMGKNARKSAESYSWENVAKMTMDVYEDVLTK